MAISFDYSSASSFFKQSEVDYLSEFIKVAHNSLHERKSPGSDFLGWLDLPINYDKDEFLRIKQADERIQGQSDALIVIGIGGSYLGARAAIEAQRYVESLQEMGNNLSYV
jgi:glucose-6-phosphate isomerase